jgi:hypothetical protein
MSPVGKRLLYTLLFTGIGIAAIQVVPYGRNHTNPPVIREPLWDSPDTRALAKRACFDCHSFETAWDAWYTRVAPASWLVQYDVDEGRKELNFSDWQSGARESEGAAKLGNEIAGGGMPPIQYLLAHPEARLSDREKRLLIDGLAATANRR